MFLLYFKCITVISLPVGQFSQSCLPTVDHTRGVKNILSRLLSFCQAISVGKMVIFTCILLYLQILFKYSPNTKYGPFYDFQFKYKYTKFWYSNTNTYLNSTLGVNLIAHTRNRGRYILERPQNPADVRYFMRASGRVKVSRGLHGH